MKVRVTFIEMILDNYQGSSGMPIKRSLFVDIMSDTEIKEVMNEVIHALTAQGIKGTFNAGEKIFPYQGIISIELPFVIPST